MMRAEQCGYISLARALNTIGVERTLSDEQVEEKSEVVEELSKKLMEAATAGNQRSVFICLTKGADLEYQDSNKDTACHLAAEKGHDDIITMLLQKGMNIDMRGYERRTPIISAAACGKLSTVKLLGSNGALLDLQDSDGKTALYRASYNDNLQMMAELLILGADPEIKNNDGNTAITFANSYGTKLLNSWQNPDVGKESMIEATKKGNEELIKALSIIGIDKIEKEEKKEVGIMLTEEDIVAGDKLLNAVKNEDLEIIKALHAEGTDLKYVNESGEMAFDIAIKEGKEDVVEFLLDQGQDVNIKTDDKYTPTPFMIAAKHGYSGIVKLLGSKGANLNVQNSYDSATALWLAVRRDDGGLETVVELLHLGADPSIKDDCDYTPAQRAKQWHGESHDVTILLQTWQKQKEVREAMNKATEEGNEKFVSAMEYIISRNEGIKCNYNSKTVLYLSTYLALEDVDEESGDEQIEQMIESEKTFVDALAFFFFKEGSDGDHYKTLLQTWQKHQDVNTAISKAALDEGNEKLYNCFTQIMSN